MSSINMCVIILRHNVELVGDLYLAQREIAALLGCEGQPIDGIEALERSLTGIRGVRRLELMRELQPVALAFSCVDVDRVVRLAHRSAFAQEIFAVGPYHVLMKLREKLRLPVVEVNELVTQALIFPSLNYILETEGVNSVPVPAGESRLQFVGRLLLSPFTDSGKESATAIRLRRAKKTSLSLTHDLHIYKAKFFPRMVRSLLNIYAPVGGVVLDPYCGSGTALLEASLLGYSAFGSDIDPICVLISDAKVSTFATGKLGPEVRVGTDFDARCADLTDLCEVRFTGIVSEVLNKIARQDRRLETNFLPEIERDLRRVSELIDREGGAQAPSLLRALVSDAVTKKVRFRFVGVGNGRYTVEVVATNIVDRLREKAARCQEWTDVFADIRSRLPHELGTVKVSRGDARARSSWPVQSDVDVIVTSPPYLPASSGREHYAASRALAFFAIRENPDVLVGNNPCESAPSRPEWLSRCPEAVAMMEYLENDRGETDPQRDPMRFLYKAGPTLAYLNDMYAFFKSAWESLRPGAVLLFVVAYQHIFYSHRRGVVEHIVRGRDLYTPIASQAGFFLEEEIPMELKKAANTRARPRSKDQYYETILVFRKPPVMAADEALPTVPFRDTEYRPPPLPG